MDITVPAGASELIVVATWDEPAADTLSNSVLNDVDLYVDHNADCANTAATCGEHSSRSAVDNVEWVTITNPAAGSYRLKVVADQIYTDNQVAIAWKVVRGKTTPQLTVASDVTEVRAGSRARYEVNLTVTSDTYIAAGVTLQLGCRAEGANPDCASSANAALISGSSTVQREDGIARPLEGEPFRHPIALGEIAAGEQQTVKLVFRSPVWDPSWRFYAVASAWNARADSTSVAVNLYENRSDAAIPAALSSPSNREFGQAVVVNTVSGNLPFDFLLASREPGEPVVSADEAAGELNVPRTLWYKWVAPETANSRYLITVENADTADPVVWPIQWDVFVGEELGTLEHVFSDIRDWVFTSGKVKSGETYYFRLSDVAGAPLKPLILRWEGRKTEPPTNDGFGQAVVISGETGTQTGDNSGATLESGEDLAGFAASAWYRWQAPSSGDYMFSVNPTSIADLSIMVFQGSSLDSMRLVSLSLDRVAAFAASAGEEYRVAVVATSADQFLSSGTFELNWSPYSPEIALLHSILGPNDHFSDARELTGNSGSLLVSSIGYWTIEPGEPAQTGARTQWLSWIPSESGKYTWRHYGRFKMSFFSGSALTDLSLITESNARENSRPQFKVDVTAGTRYWIALGLEGQDAFRRDLVVGPLAWGKTPANDNREDAATLSGGQGSVSASTFYATLEAAEPSNTAGHQSLWWSWQSPAAGWQRFWLNAGSLEKGVLTLYEQGSGGALKLVATSEMSYSLNGSSELVFEAQANNTYLVRLASQGQAYGSRDTFTLSWGAATEPIWLRYTGRITAGDSALTNSGVDLRSPGSLAFNADGDRLFVAGQQGLAVFSRNADSGALAPLQFIWNGDPAPDSSYFYTGEGSPLLWDATRPKLFASDPIFRRLHQFAPKSDKSGLDLEGVTASSDGVQPLAGMDQLIVDGNGDFIHMLETRSGYGIDFEWVILTFSFDAAGQLGFVQGLYFSELRDDVPGLTRVPDLRELKHAFLSPDDKYLYAITPSSLLAFPRNTATGELSPPSRTDFGSISGLFGSFEGAWGGITPDKTVLGVAGSAGVSALRFGLSANPGRPEYHDSLTGIANSPSRHATFVRTEAPESCMLGFSRNDSSGADVICKDVVYSVADVEGELLATDYLAAWQADRFGNEIPTFGIPRGAAASPDGRHLYVTGNEDDQVLIFERIGGREAAEE